MPFDFPKSKRLPPSLDRQLVQLYQRLEQVARAGWVVLVVTWMVATVIIGMVESGSSTNLLISSQARMVVTVIRMVARVKGMALAIMGLVKMVAIVIVMVMLL